MLIRPSLVIFLMTGLTALSGCAHLNDPPPDIIPPVTSPEFEARMEQLENTLSAQCDANLASLMALRDPEIISQEVARLNQQVRGMRDDIAKRARANEKQVVEKRLASCPKAVDLTDGKTVLGRNEWIGLPSVGTFLEARIDTGANTSSLSARDITPFERDGENWVRFKLGLNSTDPVVEAVRDDWIEAPIVRRVKIVQATGEASRPVIRLLMTLGSIRQHVEFTLTDRTHLEFPALLGRRFLLDIAIVDVARQHVHEQPVFTPPADKKSTQTTRSADTSEDDPE